MVASTDFSDLNKGAQNQEDEEVEKTEDVVMRQIEKIEELQENGDSTYNSRSAGKESQRLEPANPRLKTPK